jgi:hypothetical protein
MLFPHALLRIIEDKDSRLIINITKTGDIFPYNTFIIRHIGLFLYSESDNNT